VGVGLVGFNLRSRVFLPMAPIYLNVTPTWLIEIRSRSEEELLRLKWHGLLGTRAFGITKKELVQCIKDDLCLDALLRSICAAARTGHVKTKRKYLKSWLIFCIRYWQT